MTEPRNTVAAGFIPASVGGEWRDLSMPGRGQAPTLRARGKEKGSPHHTSLYLARGKQ